MLFRAGFPAASVARISARAGPLQEEQWGRSTG